MLLKCVELAECFSSGESSKGHHVCDSSVSIIAIKCELI